MLWAFCFWGALAAVDTAAQRTAFGVGALRRDGVIVPFAAFDGKKWVDNWPLPAAEVDVPITVRDVPSSWWGPTPALESWQAWIAGVPQQLRIERPDWFDVSCTRQIGLRSDYHATTAVPPPGEQPYPKDGLAVSPPQPIERITILPGESDETRALIPVVYDAFNKAEREFGENHPLSRREREGQTPDIEAVYAAGDHPRIYYVESSRRYRRLGQTPDQCAAFAFGTGWYVRDDTGLRSIMTVVDLLRCNRYGASYMLPLGAMHLNGKFYWLAQFAGVNHERYAVIEIKPRTVQGVLNVWGGSCSR